MSEDRCKGRVQSEGGEFPCGLDRGHAGPCRWKKAAPPPDFWVAYHADFSDLAIFVSELAAYRYALPNLMQVAGAKAGKSLREQLR